jgi:ABC-type glycerol-3-phosphate transport system substrate-binding protein
MKKKVMFVFVVVFVLLFVAACGNGGNGGNGGNEAPPPVTQEQPPAPPVPQDIPQVEDEDWRYPNGLIRGLEGELVVAGAARQFNVSDPDMGGPFEYFSTFYPNFRTRLFDRENEGAALGQLQTLIAAGSPPDVFITDSTDIPNLVRLGFVEDLTPFFDRHQAYYNTLIPQATGLNTVNDRIWGVTWQLLPRAWITNVDLFDRLGVTLPGPDWTVEDFVELNARFGANRNIGISGVQGEMHILVHQFLMAYNVNGSRWEDGLELSAFADDPNTLAALEMVLRAVYAYDTQFTQEERDAFGPNWNDHFLNGHTVWQPWSLWGQPINRETREMSFNWTVLPPPRGPAGHRGGNAGTITMALFPGTPNAELAFRYIMAATSQHFVENAYVINMGANPPAVYPAGFRPDELRFPVGFPPVAMNHVTHPDNAAALEGWKVAVSYMVPDPFSVVGIMNNQLVAYVVPGTRSMADMLREYDNWRNGYLRAGQ